MKSFVIAILGLTAFAAANPTSSSSSKSGVYVQYLSRGGIQCRRNCRNNINNRAVINECDIVNCPPAVRNGCQEPDCSLPGNILRLHPYPDPNYFYQCQRTDDFGGVKVHVRPCACGTVFSARVDETRCVHPWEWLPDCPEHPATWQNIILSQTQCRPDCETCGDNNIPPDVEGPNPPVPTPPTPSPPVPTPPTPAPPGPNPPGPNPPGDGCQCPCMPCIWFPCQPCLSVCPCNNNNNNRIQAPVQQPQPPQWQPEQRQPWQPQPPQWQPEPEQWNPDQRQPWQPQPPQLPQLPELPQWPEQRDPWQNQPPQWHPEQRPHWFSLNEEEVEAEEGKQEAEEKVESTEN